MPCKRGIIKTIIDMSQHLYGLSKNNNSIFWPESCPSFKENINRELLKKELNFNKNYYEQSKRDIRTNVKLVEAVTRTIFFIKLCLTLRYCAGVSHTPADVFLQLPKFGA
jgi:hypothetical protein